jgi:hypothetical protein
LAYTLPLRREQGMVKETEKEDGKPQKSNGHESIEVTPIQLLAIILKCVLQDRITDEEIERICSNYYKTVNEWWG